MKSRIAALIAIGSIGASAQAQTIQITNRVYGPTIQALGGESIINESFDQLAASINENIPNWNAKDIANSTTLAGSGIDADYSDVFSWGILGANAGVAVGRNIFGFFNANSAKDVPSGSAQGGVMLGFNLGKVVKTKLGPVDLERLKVYASFFTYGYDFPTDNFGLRAEITHWGLKGQYKLVLPRGPGVARWTGVDVTSGLSQSKVGLNVSTTINQSVNVDGLGGAITALAFNGTPVIPITSSVFAIPVDVSTGVQLAYFLNLYGGLGLDFAFGSTSFPASDLGDIQSTGAAAGEVSADVSITENSAGPTIGNLRYFAGLGIDGKVVGAYVQFNGNVTGQIGATLGGRLYW